MSFPQCLSADQNKVLYDVSFSNVNTNTINGGTPLTPSGIGNLTQNTFPIAGNGTLGNILRDSSMTEDMSGIHTGAHLFVGAGLGEYELPTTKGRNGDVLTSNGDGTTSFSPASGGSSISSLLISNTNQIVSANTQANIQGTVSLSLGISGGSWITDTFTSSGGVYEFNLSLSVQVGTSPNNSLYTVYNAGFPAQVLGYVGIQSTSYSCIFNMANNDTLTFVFENDDLSLSATIYNTNLTIKYLGAYRP